MSILYKKNRALKRILRNKFHGAAHEPVKQAAEAKEETANAPAYSLCADIPECYNDTYVRAIPKDPQSTFVYWEVPKENAADNNVSGKGSVHTGNGDAARIQEQLNNHHRHDGNNQWRDGNHHHSHDNNHHQWHDGNHRQWCGESNRRHYEDCCRAQTGSAYIEAPRFAEFVNTSAGTISPTPVPVSEILNILICQARESRYHHRPLPSLSSGIFYSSHSIISLARTPAALDGANACAGVRS